MRLLWLKYPYTIFFFSRLLLDEDDALFTQDWHWLRLEPQIKTLRSERQRLVAESRKINALLTCQICFNNEILMSEAVYCQADTHPFCPSCVHKGSATQIGEGAIKIKCFCQCQSYFSDLALERCLPKVVYDNYIRRSTFASIHDAGITNYDRCPHCNYAELIQGNPEVNKVFDCKECGRSTCRLCQEDSHVPLKCNEVEKPQDTANRTRVENNLAEAMIRLVKLCVYSN